MESSIVFSLWSSSSVFPVLSSGGTTAPSPSHPHTQGQQQAFGSLHLLWRSRVQHAHVPPCFVRCLNLCVICLSCLSQLRLQQREMAFKTAGSSNRAVPFFPFPLLLLFPEELGVFGAVAVPDELVAISVLPLSTRAIFVALYLSPAVWRCRL